MQIICYLIKDKFLFLHIKFIFSRYIIFIRQNFFRFKILKLNSRVFHFKQNYNESQWWIVRWYVLPGTNERCIVLLNFFLLKINLLSASKYWMATHFMSWAPLAKIFPFASTCASKGLYFQNSCEKRSKSCKCKVNLTQMSYFIL